MKRFFLVLLSVLLCLQAQAATSGSYDGKVNVAISGIVNQKLTAMGISTADQRRDLTLAATAGAMAAAGMNIYSTAAIGTGVVAAGATVAWLPILGSLAVGAAGALGLYLAVNGVTNWLFNTNGSVSASVSNGTLTSGMTARYSVCGNNITVWGLNAASVGAGCLPLVQALYPSAATYSCTTSQCDFYTSGGSRVASYGLVGGTVPSGVNCSSGIYNASSGSCGSVPLASSTPIATAIANIPQSDTGLPLNPQILAGAVNQAWQNAAAQPGYQGVPYDPTMPVTVSDVTAWQSAHADSYPTLQSALAPIASGAVAPFSGTISLPSTAAATGAGTGASTVSGTAASVQAVDVVNRVAVDLGADPGIVSPTLESTPTASMILSPLLNLFPSLKNFVVPNHSGVCPTGSFVLFGKTVEIEAHCSILEQVRSTLSALMSFAWLALSMFIILRA